MKRLKSVEKLIDPKTGYEFNFGLLERAQAWQHFAITKDDLATTVGATTAEVELFNLPPQGVIHAVVIQHTEAFDGGLLSDYQFSVGIDGSQTKYCGLHSVNGAPSATGFKVATIQGLENTDVGTPIKLFVTSTGDSINAITEGEATVAVLWSLPEAGDVEESVEFVFVGDVGMDNDDASHVAALAKAFDPDLYILGGDLGYDDGTTANYTDKLLDDWGDLIPEKVRPVWGNHDLITSESGQYGRPLLNLFPNIEELNGGKLYYEFHLGPICFFVLNSGYTDGTPREPDGINWSGYGNIQAQWFQARIAACTKPWKVVCFHRPDYTNDVTHSPGSTQMQGWPWHTQGVDLVLNGHGHNYERLTILGIPHCVVGTGGAALRGFIGSPAAQSKFRYYEKHGVLRAWANSSRLQFVFYNLENEVQDSVLLVK